MNKAMHRLSILTNGLVKENPVLILAIGTCPTLATTTSVMTGLGMGLSATAVLICSNTVISLLRRIIPDKVRIPCFIPVIAGFVTLVQMLLKAYVPSLYDALGIYLPLIVVNCIILGRAEMFACKNGPLDSALDGIGMGLGFTLALVGIGSIREFLGSGTWCGIPLLSRFMPGMGILTLVPGGFFVFALVMAAVQYASRKTKHRSRKKTCEGCAFAGACHELPAKTEA